MSLLDFGIPRELFRAEGDPGAGTGGSGTDPTDTKAERKRFVTEKIDERYKPVEVRELLARYGDKADVALENVVAKNNDIVQRLMRQNAEMEFDLAQARKQVETHEASIKTLTGERDGLKQQIEAEQRAQRASVAEGLLKTAAAGDEVRARRLRAYLKLDGYDIDAEGEGDKAKLMLVGADGKRHNFDTVVNDSFYERYSDVKPSSDAPLGGGQGGGTAPTGTSGYHRDSGTGAPSEGKPGSTGSKVAAAMREQMKRDAERTSLDNLGGN